MKKNLTRIISAALCLFLASPGVFAPEIAAETPYEAHNGIRVISDCSAVTGRRATENVPDGHGFKVALTAAGSNAENITNADYGTGIYFTRAELEKGAFVIYFSHDETRLRAADGKTEKTYADNVFMLIFDNMTGGARIQLGGNKESTKPIYFVSSSDGRLLRFDTANASTGLAVDKETGTYYSEGYWIIPGASLNLDGISAEGSHSLAGIKCNPRNRTANGGYVNATCNFYYDNFCFAENLSDIFGTSESGGFEYEAGSVYPVYKLGPQRYAGKIAAPCAENGLKLHKNRISLKRGRTGYRADIYTDKSVYISSVEVPAGSGYTSAYLACGGDMLIQAVSGGSVSPTEKINCAGDINRDGARDVRDIIALKKLTAAAGCEYNSDLSGDGRTDAADTVLLRQMLLGLETAVFAGETVETYVYDENNYPDYSGKYGVSKLENSKNNKFIFKGAAYTYAVTAANEEILALNDRVTGDIIDITDGGGTAVLNDDGNALLVKKSGIERLVPEGNKLSIYYSLTGAAAENASIVNTYTFLENCIKVSQHITFKSDKYTAAAKYSSVARKVFQSYTSEDARMVSKWVYPENGDYPYQLGESVGTVMKFDNNHSLYTFLSVAEDAVLYPPSHPKQSIPLTFENGKDIDMTAEYSLVPATVSGGEYDGYLPLFSGRGSDFAAGVFPVTENTEKSTVFVGDSVDLRLNVSNLVPHGIKYTLCYSLYDYYGMLIDVGSFEDVPLAAETAENRVLHIEGKYGVYYIDLRVRTDNYEHTECYPFALIPSAEYKYRSTNPFGIASAADNGVESDAMLAGKLNIKVGTGNYRFVGNSKGYQRQMTEYLHENGVKINVQLNMNSIKPWGFKTVEEFVKAMNDYLPGLRSITDSVEIGNEINFSYTEGKEEDPAAYAERYINDMYIPSSDAVHSAGFKYANAGISACDTNWFDKVMGKTQELWDRTDILSVHPYGHPCVPDLCGRGEQSGKWNYEAALIRTVNALKKHGEKEWYITETGNTTPPLNMMQTDLRTQADYEMRELILGHAYGASRIQLYCFFDRASYNNGYSAEDAELNYGIFYQPDFLGVVKPKPAAAAFAVINSVTDGIEKTEEYGKYTRADGTLRVFKITRKDGGDVYAVWSNKYPLSNGIYGKQTERVPSIPWIDKWTGKYENVTFETENGSADVTDVMGNKKVYTAKDGKVTVPVSGSILYISGIK